MVDWIEERKKLYVVGLDSTPLWIITRLYKKYGMKGFEEFFKSGFLKEMESTLPPESASAWASIYSGLEPKDHGVMDFLVIDRNYTRQLIYYDQERHRPFWDLLAEKGIRSLVVTPPMILQKSRSNNVDMITGWPLPPKYSSRRLESVAKRFNFKGEPDIEVDLEQRKISIKEGLKEYLQGVNARAEMCKHLIENGDYDLVFVCFSETDRIYHYVFTKSDWETYIAQLYKATSDFTEWVIDHTRTGNENSVVMLLSDHGAQRIKSKFLLNTWLIDEGYAKLKTGSIGEQNKSDTTGTKAKKYLSERMTKFRLRRVVYNSLPAFMKEPVERFVTKNLDESYRGYKKIYESDFDMPRTKLFAAVSYGPTGMIWINDERFARPGIDGNERTRIKREIMERLKRIKTNNGERLVPNVFDGAKYYGNKQDFIAPDVLLELRSGYTVDFSYYSKDNIFMEPDFVRHGDHSRFGIFGLISNNKDFDLEKLRKKRMSVQDVSGVVLSYFGYGRRTGKDL